MAKISAYEPQLRRSFKLHEVTAAVAKVYSGKGTGALPNSKSPTFPKVNPEAVEEALARSQFKSLADLRAASQLIPSEGVSDFILDHLYPGNPLLCMGDSPYSFGTVLREEVRGQLRYVSLIVPSPMTSYYGHKKSDGELSPHTEDNTGPRKILVCEFDGGQSLDHQASLIGWLANFAPLVCVCFSGGKSLHASFNVAGHPEEAVLKFFKYSVSLGADQRMWSRSQFCRLPGGYNHDKDQVQEVHYLNLGHFLIRLPEPPMITPSFPWALQAGADAWTGDPAQIVNMSDPPLIDGIMRRCEVGTIVGAAKTSKTWFALGLALATAMGVEFLGRRTHKSKTLYLDYELKPNTFRKRMCMLATAKPDGFHFQCLRGTLELPSVDQIAELIISEGIEFVVVDSLYRTGWLSEENSNDSTGRELAILQQLSTRTGCTILVVDHTAKGGGNDRSAVDASRGASTKGGFFDFILVLRSTAKGPDPEGNYVIVDPVLRDWPGLKNLPLVSFQWSPLSCRISLEGEVPSDDPQLVKSRVLESLAGQEPGVKIKQLTEFLGVSETTLRRSLTELVDEGKILKLQDPGHSQRFIYQLVSEEETASEVDAESSQEEGDAESANRPLDGSSFQAGPLPPEPTGCVLPPCRENR